MPVPHGTRFSRLRRRPVDGLFAAAGVVLPILLGLLLDGRMV